MSTLVEVALIGSIEKQRTGGDMIPRSALRKPYQRLPKVAIQVSDEMTLGEIARRALEDMCAPEWAAKSPSFDVGFYRPEDEDGVDGNWAWFIVLVDEHGRARWRYPVNDVRFDEVVQAAEAGAIPGDPTRMHVAMTPQIGDGALPMWPEIVDAYRLLKDVLEVLGAPGAVYASYQMIKHMREKAGKAADSLEVRSSAWAEQGANPYTFEQWLDDHTWHPRDLAPLLDCSIEEAEAVLWAMGFGPLGDGRWKRSADPEAKLMDGNRTLMIHMGLERADEEEVRNVLRDRIEETARTGTAPDSPDWRQLPWMQRQFENLPRKYRAMDWLLERWHRLRRHR